MKTNPLDNQNEKKAADSSLYRSARLRNFQPGILQGSQIRVEMSAGSPSQPLCICMYSVARKTDSLTG